MSQKLWKLAALALYIPFGILAVVCLIVGGLSAQVVYQIDTKMRPLTGNW